MPTSLGSDPPSALLSFCVRPIGLFWLLYRHRDKINTQEFKEKWLFLYGGFRGELCWWEVCVLARKFLLIAVTVFLAHTPPFQIIAAIWVMGCFFTLQAVWQPYADPTEGLLETLSLGATLATLLVGQILVLGDLVPGLTEDGAFALRCAAGILNIAVFAVFMHFLVRDFRQRRKENPSSWSMIRGVSMFMSSRTVGTKLKGAPPSKAAAEASAPVSDDANCEDWEQVEGAEGTYYWNSATGETSWERPGRAPVVVENPLNTPEHKRL